MAHKSKLVEEQINKLLEAQSRNYTQKPQQSPMINQMLNIGKDEEKKVQKLKKIFEEREHEEKRNDNEKCSRSPSMFSCIRRISSSSSSPPASRTVRRIEGLVRELVQNERDYIGQLEKGIENYLNPIASDNPEIPEDLRYQKFKLFGNIEEICSLHKSTVLPHLLSCGDNIHQIAETLINLTQSDAFYCYINYAINHLQAQEFLISHAACFTRLQKKCDDRLGVMSFIILPIQKIPRYPLILEEMIKELSVDMHKHKQALASLCMAKKKIEKFLARVNQAMTINDIIETREVPVKLQCGLITCLQIEFGVSINEPTLILVPSFSSQHGYRSPINVFKLGKFIRTSFVNAHEHFNSRIFESKLYLFEKCLLYTKVHSRIGNPLLAYRDHFWFGPSMVIKMRTHEEMMIIGDTTTNRYVSFTAADFEIFEIFKQIKSFYNPRDSQDSAFGGDVENMEEEEGSFVNESMADWFITDNEMLNLSGENTEPNDKNNKKILADMPNSRFYVASPNVGN